MSLWSRMANVFRSGRVARELDEELAFHLEERTRALMSAGMTRDAAAREAARRLGGPLRLREQSLDVKLLPWLDSLVRDVRLGLRMLRRSGAVTAAAVLSLSLALGACIAAFALVDALILRPLPVTRPDRLVYLTFATYSPERPEADTFNDPLFLRLRDAARGRADLFAMSTQVLRQVRFGGGSGEKERLRTQFVSGDAFERLGIRPFAGRLFTADDDRKPGAHPVAIVSHAFWRRRFGGDPAALGASFALEGSTRLGSDLVFDIVGVAEPGFAGVEPGRPTDLWLPYAMYNPRAFGNADSNWFRIFGRLVDGVRVEDAQSVLQAAFTGFRRDRAGSMGRGPDRSPQELAQFLSTPLHARSAANGPSPLRRQFERPLWILAAIAALVLLIAGSNVANLFLARAAAREREMALRLSIGAGRVRLIQQLLVESGLVALAVCLLGLIVAAVAAPSVVAMLTLPEDPVRLDLRAGWRVVGVAAALVLVTTGLVGVIPALRASAVSPMGTANARAPRASARSTAMRPFVAIQVAFALAVVFAGSLLVMSFVRLARVDPGFATSRVLLVSVEPVRRVDPAEQRAALTRVLDHLRQVPSVESASSAEFNALGRAWTHFVRLPNTTEAVEVTMAPVTDGFFETMKIPIVAGRAFEGADMRAQQSTAIVVNESFAARYFSGGRAVGRTLTVRFGEADQSDAHEVIGVAADTRFDLHQPPAPIIYIPLTLRNSGTLHVRIATDAAAAAARIRDEVRAADPLFRVTAITSQADAVARTMLRERLLALLSGFFALVGLTLAAVGLHGVLSYAVVQRTREIGIRLALGAARRTVVGMVLADAARTTLTGAVAGIAAGLFLSRFVESLLFEVTAFGFWSLALPLTTLLITALLASALPAMRASRVDPAVALRHE
jgi:predicted permease